MLGACKNATLDKTTPIENYKIVSIGGAITETLFALDLGSNIQAIDVTSTYPEQINNLPKLGTLVMFH
ncbi:MAG: hypothetical protein R2728_12925 [Chitinophagales bacterium]